MPKKTILVIDDEEDFHIILRRTLEPAGFKVLSAMSSEEALRMLDAKIPDAALVDWNLPGMSGLDLCTHIRRDSRFAGMLLVMVTVRDTPDDQICALEQGKADSHIAKPVVPEVLLEKLNSLFKLKER